MKAKPLLCLFGWLTTFVFLIFLGSIFVFLWRTGVYQPNLGVNKVPTVNDYKRLYEQIITESGDEMMNDTKLRLNDPHSYEWKALQWMLAAAHDERRRNNDNLLQRFAIATIFFSFDLERLLSPHQHECNIDPMIINCSSLTVAGDEPKSVVSSLNFRSVSPVGSTIPNAISFLSHLEKLDLTDLGLKGTLPFRMFHRWSNLRELLLSNNHLTSVFHHYDASSSSSGTTTTTTWPTTIEVLDLSDNDLDEVVPSHVVANWNQLRYLNFRGNSRLSSDDNSSSSFLHALHWRSLQYLNIAETNLTSSLPDHDNDADHYSQLQVLAAGYTPLTGTLPKSLSNASNLKILQLGIAPSNALSGTLPESYQQLTQIEQLSIVRTKTTGTLPSGWGKSMPLLRALDLYENPGLTGTIPSEWRGMTSLEVVRLVDTGLTGTVPSFMSQWTKLQSLSFHRTTLTGNVSDAICKLPFLTILRANCGGDFPEVDCECCTFCWRRGND